MFRDGDEVWIGEEWLGVCMDYESKWKPVGDDTDGTERMKVPGGWLYRTLVISTGQTTALAFVPDSPRLKPAKKLVIKRR